MEDLEKGNQCVPAENPEYLQSQLITYIGNKRSLLPFIEQAVNIIKSSLNKEKLTCLDIFSGSGIVSRFLKQHSSFIAANDLENYACIISKCYLSNKTADLEAKLKDYHSKLTCKISEKMAQLEKDRQNGSVKAPGFISELYSPADSLNIQKEERCFYTTYNANYIDIARQLIQSEIPEEYQNYFIAPLLSEASIHANTAGIFKGFYKNSKTKTGQFGGNGKNALSRIMGQISLPLPQLSNFECQFQVFNQNANSIVCNPQLYQNAGSEGIFDLAYFDPPYNQHPYGSNYFMLNLIADYQCPDKEKISRVSGIPRNWNRSAYNKKKQVCEVFYELVNNVKARFILVSFNSEGFISKDEMIQILERCGSVQVLESQYNTFRGSRNLKSREIHVKEYLFLVHKTGLEN